VEPIKHGLWSSGKQGTRITMLFMPGSTFLIISKNTAGVNGKRQPEEEKADLINYKGENLNVTV
jgi:hypothetical protein